MKSSFSVFSIAMLSLWAAASGQPAQQPAAAVSDAQKSFAVLKTLAGNWQGSITTDSPAWSTDKPMALSIRVASHGNALIHELNTGGPEVTIIYLDGDRLALTHYCDYGNLPHMIARPSPEGNQIDFELADFSGSDAIGHVTRGVFTVIDSNHHIEDWTFVPQGTKPVHARMDFKRVQ